MKLIATQTVTTAGPSITFSDIPQNFTDLVVKISGRASGGGGTRDDLRVTINGDAGSNYAYRRIIGYDGSSVASDAGTGTPSALAVVNITGNGATANTFSNTELYFSNYTSASSKAFSTDATAENNSASSYIMGIIAQRYTTSSPITSISFAPNTDFVIGSTISLYGIGGVGGGYAAPKATGGAITYADGYTIHTFAASGTFTPTTNLTDVDYLVVAGGGGGGWIAAGGGGAGGLRSTLDNTGGGGSLESKLSLTSGTAYTVTVGAGGATVSSSNGANGSNSVFSTITSTGGGGGGNNATIANNGGSGGGGANRNGGSPQPAAGTGTANQGFAGGLGNNGTAPTFGAGGGGGGAGAIGSAATSGNSNIAGIGGDGVLVSITGSSTAYAGGGGGSSRGTGGAGGTGGGGKGADGSAVGSANAVAGTASRGSGGGGGFTTEGGNAANGGSGIVIVRYAS
jgi:hypothetical protein